MSQINPSSITSFKESRLVWPKLQEFKRNDDSLQSKSTVYSLQSTVYSLRSTVYSLQYAVYSLKSIGYRLQSTVYKLQATIISLQSIVYYTCSPNYTNKTSKATFLISFSFLLNLCQLPANRAGQSSVNGTEVFENKRKSPLTHGKNC